MVENEMKALRISEEIGAVASRMRVIFMAARSLRRHAHALREHGKPLADQVDMSAQIVELVGVVRRHAHDPHVRIDAIEFGLHSSSASYLGPPLSILRSSALSWRYQ